MMIPPFSHDGVMYYGNVMTRLCYPCRSLDCTPGCNAAVDRPVCFCILGTNPLLLHCAEPQALYQALYIIHCQCVLHD